jgi:hypothetical protein
MSLETPPADTPTGAASSRRELVVLGALGWLASLGVDLFLNAAVFAGVFFEPSPFLLSPEELFVRIPLGYLSFLLMTGFLVWLMAGRSVVGLPAGARFGFVVGAVVHGAGALALASVSTARPSFLVTWFVAQTVQTVVVGAVVGRGLAGASTRRLAVAVLVLDAVLVVTTFALQSLGLVPTPV